jgi:hypothetical protein
MKAIHTTLVASALVLAAPLALAEDSHHPDESTPATQIEATQQQTAAGAASGGTMSGMMSPDMVRMMGMMAAGNGPATAQAGSMGPMMSPEHIEGRLAFLRVELDVTEAQQPLWEALAEAMRQTTGNTGAALPVMQGGVAMNTGATTGSPVQRIQLEERVLIARLEALQKVKAALEPFYAALDEAQKQKADRLLAPAPMGMM